MNWIWSLFQPFLADSAPSLPPARPCPFHTRASHRAVPRGPSRGAHPPGGAHSAQLRQPGPAPPCLHGDCGPPPLARAPPYVPLHLCLSQALLRQKGGRGGVCGGARVTMSGLTRGSTGRLTVWGASEVRSQPTHWGRGPGAQVEYLREDMHGACPEEGGDPETDCLPTGAARAGAGQQGRVWRPGCRPAGLPGAAQIPSSSGHVGTLTLVTVSATFGSGTETGEGGGWVLL